MDRKAVVAIVGVIFLISAVGVSALWGSNSAGINKSTGILASESAKIGAEEIDVLGEQTVDETFEVIAKITGNPKPIAETIRCMGLDGKVAITSQAVCDFVTKFWKENTPSVNHNTGNGNSNTNENSGSVSPTSMPTPSLVPTGMISPTATPIPQLTFTGFQGLYCSINSSCYPHVFGVVVHGTNLPVDARLRLIRYNQYYNGSLQGRDSTYVLEDFSGLPLCGVGYTMEVYSESNPAIRVYDPSYEVDGYCPPYGWSN